MIAALNPSNDSLTVVLLNTSSSQVRHNIDLTMFRKVESPITVTRTSETEDNAEITDYDFNESSLSVELPGSSVTTFVIPVGVDSGK